jgi:hypothetical protein
MENKVTDKYVLGAVEEMLNRSVIGTQKYGTTLERTDLTFLDWTQHLKEELMDAVNYLQRLQSFKKELESMEKLKKYSLVELEKIVEIYESQKKDE